MCFTQRFLHILVVPEISHVLCKQMIFPRSNPKAFGSWRTNRAIGREMCCSIRSLGSWWETWPTRRRRHGSGCSRERRERWWSDKGDNTDTRKHERSRRRSCGRDWRSGNEGDTTETSSGAVTRSSGDPVVRWRRDTLKMNPCYCQVNSGDCNIWDSIQRTSLLFTLMSSILSWETSGVLKSMVTQVTRIPRDSNSI